MGLQIDQTEQADLLCQKTCNTNVSSLSTVWSERESLGQRRSSDESQMGTVVSFNFFDVLNKLKRLTSKVRGKQESEVLASLTCKE